MNFFRILDDLSLKNRWFLSSINLRNHSEIWKFVQAGYISKPQKGLKIDILEQGNSLDLTMCDFEVLIANQKAASLFSEDDVQKIPILINSIEEPYFIIVIKNELDCVDREKSEYLLWKEGNEIRPDLAGTYQVISKLILDTSVIGDMNIFRVKGYNVALIVSEKIKNQFDAMKLTGIRFCCISN